jgi:hypothetical protein
MDIETQERSPFSIARLLPHKNYAKKNVAYLQAISKGATMIIETDDDNLPESPFWLPRNAQVKGDIAGGESWVNVYRYFTDALIWPRGFSLKHLKNSLVPLKPSDKSIFSPIQQALVDKNPDVDAIYRLMLPLPFDFKKREPVILDQGAACPFNSQNTTWFKEAFALLYLPSYCSFRMCDIWRSFVAQRILWTNGWHLSFHSSSAYQERNEHDLIKDFEDEVSGYLNNHNMMDQLNALDLEAGEANIFENLERCYEMLIEQNYIGKEEMPLLKAWIADLRSLG